MRYSRFSYKTFDLTDITFGFSIKFKTFGVYILFDFWKYRRHLVIYYKTYPDLKW